MPVTRRKFTLDFKTEAAHRVIDQGNTAANLTALKSDGDFVCLDLQGPVLPGQTNYAYAYDATTGSFGIGKSNQGPTHEWVSSSGRCPLHQIGGDRHLSGPVRFPSSLKYGTPKREEGDEQSVLHELRHTGIARVNLLRRLRFCTCSAGTNSSSVAARGWGGQRCIGCGHTACDK